MNEAKSKKQKDKKDKRVTLRKQFVKGRSHLNPMTNHLLRVATSSLSL